MFLSLLFYFFFKLHSFPDTYYVSKLLPVIKINKKFFKNSLGNEIKKIIIKVQFDLKSRIILTI
jgi:hypothetical protein